MRLTEIEHFPTEEEKLARVKQNGWNIRFIENPSEKVQLAAIKQNTRVIREIKNPSERVISIFTDIQLSNLKSWTGEIAKKDIIKHILDLIPSPRGREGRTRDQWRVVLYYTIGLKLKGYKWSELDVIEKSARKELNEI